jgi:hypothetical protein
VAGFAFSAVSIFVASPGGQAAMGILFVCRTPPKSDLFEAPVQPLDCRFLAAESQKKGERELGRVERLLGKSRDSFFNFNRVHRPFPMLT